MRSWDYRPDEVKNLLNPAFCGRVIYGTISEYQKNTKKIAKGSKECNSASQAGSTHSRNPTRRETSAPPQPRQPSL